MPIEAPVTTATRSADTKLNVGHNRIK